MNVGGLISMQKKVFFFITIYLISALIMFLFFNSEINQSIYTTEIDIGINDFFMILLKNSVASLWLLSGLILGESVLYTFFVINGISLGLLTSSFNTLKYLILVVPHGVFEITSFIYICSVVINWRDGKINNKELLKKISLSFSFLIFSAGVEAFVTPKMAVFI